MADSKSMVLGINGLGRVGKLLLWTEIARKDFAAIVVNIGRPVGTSIQSIIDSVLHDSTYGSLSSYLFGLASGKEVSVRIVGGAEGLVEIDGMPVRFLTTHRNPVDIQWEAVSLVVDATGKFVFPTSEPFCTGGSARGHFMAPNVKKVILSSPFKLRSGEKMPADAVTIVLGINDDMCNPERHKIISNASCTTTCLAHMLRPLVDIFGIENLKSMVMRTIHAGTGKQVVLDRLPKEGETDPVKYRAMPNNIFLTTTGAAKALKWVMPQLENVPFSAKSIRIPTNTGSIVFLDATWKVDGQRVKPDLSSKDVNLIYQEVAAGNRGRRYLKYVARPIVSSDIIGRPNAAAVIDGLQTDVICTDGSSVTTLTHGWYDNELGSYVNMLADQAAAVARSM